MLFEWPSRLRILTYQQIECTASAQVLKTCTNQFPFSLRSAYIFANLTRYMDGANVGTQALSVTLDGIESVLTAHNLLFTTLTLGLLVPKAILCYEGKSAAPNALDWFYGVVVAVA